MSTVPAELSLVLSRALGKVMVHVRGEVDGYSAPRLREALHALIEAGEVDLVVDLRQMPFIDSTGLGVLVGAARRARAAGGELTLSAPRPTALKALEISGVAKAITITHF